MDWIGLGTMDRLWARQTFNTFRTKRFLDHTSIFHYANTLQVGPKLSFGRFHREASILPKRGRLPTIFTLSHWASFLSTLEFVDYNARNHTTGMMDHQSTNQIGGKLT